MKVSLTLLLAAVACIASVQANGKWYDHHDKPELPTCLELAKKVCPGFAETIVEQTPLLASFLNNDTAVTTFFCPNDAALPQAIVPDRVSIQDVLYYHVNGEAKILSKDLPPVIPTILGRNLTVRIIDRVVIQGELGSFAYVLKPDLECSQGVLHVIDFVLIPDVNSYKPPSPPNPPKCPAPPPPCKIASPPPCHSCGQKPPSCTWWDYHASPPPPVSTGCDKGDCGHKMSPPPPVKSCWWKNEHPSTGCKGKDCHKASPPPPVTTTCDEHKCCKGHDCWYKQSPPPPPVTTTCDEHKCCKGHVCWYKTSPPPPCQSPPPPATICDEHKCCKGHDCWYKTSPPPPPVTTTCDEHKCCKGHDCWYKTSPPPPCQSPPPPATMCDEHKCCTGDHCEYKTSPPPPVISGCHGPNCGKQCTTVYQIICADANLSVFKMLIDMAGLKSILDDPNFIATIYAPTNQAFHECGVAGLVANQQGLILILKNHIIPGVAVHKDQYKDGMCMGSLYKPSCMSCNGDDVSVKPHDTGVSGKIIHPYNVEACKAIVHYVSAVLLPKW